MLTDEQNVNNRAIKSIHKCDLSVVCQVQMSTHTSLLLLMGEWRTPPGDLLNRPSEYACRLLKELAWRVKLDADHRNGKLIKNTFEQTIFYACFSSKLIILVHSFSYNLSIFPSPPHSRVGQGGMRWGDGTEE